MRNISILGCGWLGFPLAKSLQEKGFSVIGSTTSREKIPIFQDAGIVPFLIELKEIEIIGDIRLFLKSEILVIDIPPKLHGAEKENFKKKIETVIPFIEKSIVEKVLFISSTSVYGDRDATISEESIAHPDTESGLQLLAVERLLKNNLNFETTILRFGGLIGEDRHPVKSLSGKKNISNPDVPINLIHQKDCIGIILKIIEKEAWNETFNAVTPFHPTRRDYYTQKAAALNLALPEFNSQNLSAGKTVLSDKVEKILGYEFIEPML